MHPRTSVSCFLSLPPSLPPSYPLDGFCSADARSQALALLPLLPHRGPTITLTRPGPGSGTGGEHQPESLACGESGPGGAGTPGSGGTGRVSRSS